MCTNVVETDLLVIGGGGAGFKAAISAREKDIRVLLLSKGPLARCGATPMAGADFTLNGRILSEMGFNIIDMLKHVVGSDGVNRYRVHAQIGNEFIYISADNMIQRQSKNV